MAFNGWTEKNFEIYCLDEHPNIKNVIWQDYMFYFTKTLGKYLNGQITFHKVSFEKHVRANKVGIVWHNICFCQSDCNNNSKYNNSNSIFICCIYVLYMGQGDSICGKQ